MYVKLNDMIRMDAAKLKVNRLIEIIFQFYLNIVWPKKSINKNLCEKIIVKRIKRLEILCGFFVGFLIENKNYTIIQTALCIYRNAVILLNEQ